MNKSAVVLLSGGLDSVTALALASSEGFEAYCISFDYGQRHRVELECAAKAAKQFNVLEYKVIHIDPYTFSGSALTSEQRVPKRIDFSHLSSCETAVTYVPARNTIFLSYALGYAEINDSDYIFIGANAADYFNYPDCRSEYINAYESMANLATTRGISGRKLQIKAPFLTMKKSEIISIGLKLGVDYALTSSCYHATIIGRACGVCDACLLRSVAFHEIGMEDPLFYKCEASSGM